MKLKQDEFIYGQEEKHGDNIMDNIIRAACLAVRVCLPASIISYDRAAGICECSIEVMEQSKSGKYYEMPDLFNIPVSFCEGGGYGVNLPLKKGDKGWLIFNDLDISKFKEVLKLQSPNTGRRHDLMDAFFLPMGIRQMQIAEEDNGRAVFQKLDGSVKISMGQEDIHIVGNVNHDGNLTVNGNVQVNGTISATDTITSDVDCIGGGISLKNHTHGYVGAGQGSSPQTTDPPS